MASFEDVVPTDAEVESALRRHGVTPPAPGIERVVAILVSGRGVARSTWSDDVEVSEADFDRLLDERFPEPDLDDLDGKTFRAIDAASRSAPMRRCTECLYLPADGKCLRCGGSGRVSVGSGEGDTEKCSACSNGIAFPCSVCGGSKRSVGVKILYGEDSVRRFAHIFLPELRFSLRQPLTTFFSQRGHVPDVLGIDLAESFETADAYRGRRSRGEVRGHRADAAVALAKAYVDRVERLPSLVAVRSVAFAWPMCVGGARGEDDPVAAPFAVIKDEHGATHIVR
jgi:hypothetical protein